MTVIVKCDSCGNEIEAVVNEWTYCPKCGCSIKPEYRLVVHYGRRE
jgi:predicted RNA-binding Zn-ribbon protein involved in translation (DUF1610 family)